MLNSGDKVLLGTAVIIWCGIKRTLKLELDCGRAGFGGLTLWWKCFPPIPLCRFTRLRGTVLLANSDVSAGKSSSPQVPPRCREHKNPELFQAYESGKTTAEEGFLKPDQKWGKERLQSAVSTAGSQDTCSCARHREWMAPWNPWTLLLKGNRSLLLSHPPFAAFISPFGFRYHNQDLEFAWRVGRDTNKRSNCSGAPWGETRRRCDNGFWGAHGEQTPGSDHPGGEGDWAQKLNFSNTCEAEIVNGKSLWHSWLWLALWFLGVSCARPGVGLDDLHGSFPAQEILWFYAMIFMDENPWASLLFVNVGPCSPSYQNLIQALLLKSKCILFMG